MTANAPKKPHRLPRFSLRSLILCIVLITSGTGLWYRWEPWGEMIALDPDRLFWFASDNQYFAVPKRGKNATIGKDLEIWDTELTKCDRLTGFSGYPYYAVMSPNARRLLVVSMTGSNPPEVSTSLWTLPKKERLGEWIGNAYGSKLSSTRFEVRAKGSVLVCDVETGQTLASVPNNGVNVFHNLSPDGSILLLAGNILSVSSDGEEQYEILVWNVESDGLQSKLEKSGAGDVSAGFTPDSRWITLHWQDNDKTALHDPISGAQKYHIRGKISAYLDRGRRAVVVTTGKCARIIDTETGRDVIALEQYADDEIKVSVVPNSQDVVFLGTVDDKFKVTVVPKTQYILLASDDDSVQIWSPEGQHRRTLTYGGDHVPDIYLDPERQIIFVVGGPNVDTFVLDGRTFNELAHMNSAMEFLRGDLALMYPDANSALALYSRRRPEYWWGVAWLPEFWLTVVLGVGLVWSAWRDRTRLTRQ